MVYFRFFSLHDFLKRQIQILHGHAHEEVFQRLIFFPAQFRNGFIRRFIQQSGSFFRPYLPFCRYALDLLIFQQTFHQFRAGVWPFFLSFFLRFRQQQLAFDFQKSCRHHQKFAHTIHVAVFRRIQIGKILICQRSDGDIVNINFIFLDQMIQQIHGPFKGIQPYGHLFHSFTSLQNKEQMPQKLNDTISDGTENVSKEDQKQQEQENHLDHFFIL